MKQLFSNNASTTIAQAIASADAQIIVADGALFSEPQSGDYELLTLHNQDYSQWEVVKLVGRTGNTLSVIRGHEGTPKPWVIGSIISANITADTLNQLRDNASNANLAAQQAQTDAQNAINAATEAKHQAAIQSAYFYSAGDMTDGATQEQWAVATLGETLQYPSLPSSDPNTLDVAPIPFLGVTPYEQTQVAVFKNGVPQKTFYNEYYITGLIPNDTAHQGMVEIIDHRRIRFIPPLTATDEIVIIAPACPWRSGHGSRYPDLYRETGVQSSYIAGGYDADASADINTIQKFNWYTLTASILASANFNTGSAMQEGNGGATNRVSTGYFFGGGVNGVNQAVRYNFQTNADTVILSNVFPNATSFGTTFSDGIHAYICGVSADDTGTAIAKFNMGTEVAVMTGLNASGSPFRYPDAVCDDTKGYLFHNSDSQGNTGGFIQSYQIATDTLSAQKDLGYALTSPPSAALFRSGQCFVWHSQSGTDGILKIDLATEAVAIAQRSYQAPTGGNPHNVVCDGEYYALDIGSGLFSKDTETVSRQAPRTQNGFSYINRIYKPIGSFTDKWGNS